MAQCSYKEIPNLLDQIEKGQPAPVYLIAGDAFLGQELFQQLVSLLVPEQQRSFNLELVDGEREDIRSTLERMQTFPFLPGRKVVAVKNPVQVFSSGGEDRLWKRAEETWRKGELERSSRILQTLLRNSGISMDLQNSKREALEAGIKEKWFPGPGETLPEWIREALSQMASSGAEEFSGLNPDQLLESALRQGFPAGHILILLLEGPPGTKKIVKSIAELGVVCHLNVRQGKKAEQAAALKGLIKTTLSQEGKTIHPQAEALLLERVGPETALLKMELRKLAAFLGDRKQILSKDVMELSGGLREEPLYELTGVLGERKMKEGLEKLRQLGEQGYNPLQILSAVANTLRRLLIARELLEKLPPLPSRVWQDYGAFSTRVLPLLKDIPLPDSLSKTHPFVLYNTLRTTQNFSWSQLISALQSLQDTDRLLKTSGVEAAFLLQDFIISFCKKQN
ncbi:MAG: DNA polymerase III subunit delta [Thermodesulfobacteriota bacterium]